MRAITLQQDNYIVRKATAALLSKKKRNLPVFIVNVKMPQFYLRNYFKNISEHSDSMMEDGIATAAW